MRIKTLLSCAVLFASFGLTVPTLAEAGNWVKFTSKKYGFSMKVPKGTRLTGSAWRGWGALKAKFGVATLWGMARLGKQHTSNEISSFGIAVTGIPAKYWKQIAKGKKVDGWKWLEMYQASDKKHVVWGVIGTGKKGSYLLILKTTAKDAKKNAKDYLKWARSLKLF